MGYRRSMFPKSSSRLGKSFLSGIILGGTLGTVYGVKKVVDKVNEIPNSQSLKNNENVGLGFKCFIYMFLIAWVIGGVFVGVWTFKIIGYIIVLPAMFLLWGLLKDESRNYKRKKVER